MCSARGSSYSSSASWPSGPRIYSIGQAESALGSSASVGRTQGWVQSLPVSPPRRKTVTFQTQEWSEPVLLPSCVLAQENARNSRSPSLPTTPATSRSTRLLSRSFYSFLLIMKSPLTRNHLAYSSASFPLSTPPTSYSSMSRKLSYLSFRSSFVEVWHDSSNSICRSPYSQ